jgi:class 3 adenylate cyclase
VLVSGALARGVKGLRSHDHGHLRLRGKTDTVHVYELVGLQEEPHAALAPQFVRKGTSGKNA